MTGPILEKCGERGVFLSHPLFGPLTANSIGRVTKNIFLQLGIPMAVFGAHSTRGGCCENAQDFGFDFGSGM